MVSLSEINIVANTISGKNEKKINAQTNKYVVKVIAPYVIV